MGTGPAGEGRRVERVEVSEVMKVVHCQRDAYTHYIGRPSSLGNPFVLGRDGNRAQVIRQFEFYARNTPGVLADIRALPADAILGCWCHPKPCHGDVIIKLWHE